MAYCKWTSITNGIRTFCCGEEDYLNSINYIIGRKEGKNWGHVNKLFLFNWNFGMFCVYTKEIVVRTNKVVQVTIKVVEILY